MIKVKKIPKPSVLESEPHCSHIKDFNAATKKNPMGEKVFPEKWRTVKSIKEDLFKLNNGKCAYCESQERDKRTMDVEHFRPKSKVHGVNTHPGYWWLACETDNYLLSCKVCNSDHKGCHFPVFDENARATDEGNDLSLERPVLINPAEEDPSDFIGFKSRSGPINIAVAVGLDEQDRGNRTIKICGLNDDDLCQARGDCLSTLQLLAQTMYHALLGNDGILREKTAQKIKEYTGSRKPFLGYRRDYFRDVDLAEYIAND